MALSSVLRLEYDIAAVPEGGSQVYCKYAGLVKSIKKDAAGHAYHEKSLMQAGLYGALRQLLYPIWLLGKDGVFLGFFNRIDRNVFFAPIFRTWS